jgi:protein O-GlcNAc transferase
MRLLRIWMGLLPGIWVVSLCFATPLSELNSRREQLRAADAAFHAGYDAEKKGDLTDARAQFEKVVRLAPQIAQGHSALGAVLVQVGEYGKAIPELKRSLELAPGDRTAEINLAMAYEQFGDHAKSLSLFRALDRNGASPLPESVAILYIRALAAIHESEAARAKAQSALAANPDSPVLHDALGSLEAQRQNWNVAIPQFRESIRLDRKFAEAYLHLGLALMMEQQSAEGLQALTTAVELAPQNARMHLELGKALVANGDNPRAASVLQQALALDPSSRETKYQLGLALQAAGEEQRAIPLFQEVVAGDPRNAQALTNLGLALVQVGKAKEAVPFYERALKETPGDPLIHQDLGVAYLQESNLDDAIAEFREGLRVAPDAYELHYDLGLALKLKDDLDAATTELETAARLNPNSPDPPFTLGILNMQRGRFDDAAEELGTALRLRPENGDGWATLGSVFKQQGKMTEATDALRKAIALMPSQPGPHITLASVLAQQGQSADAAAERKKAAELSRNAVNRQRATFAVNTGNALLMKGEVSDAIARYQEAVSNDPTYIEAHRGLAAALERAGRTSEATAENLKVTELTRAQP